VIKREMNAVSSFLLMDRDFAIVHSESKGNEGMMGSMLEEDFSYSSAEKKRKRKM
jgi:hypothetical protein